MTRMNWYWCYCIYLLCNIYFLYFVFQIGRWKFNNLISEIKHNLRWINLLVLGTGFAFSFPCSFPSVVRGYKLWTEKNVDNTNGIYISIRFWSPPGSTINFLLHKLLSSCGADGWERTSAFNIRPNTHNFIIHIFSAA